LAGNLNYKVIGYVDHKYAGTASGVLGTNTLGARFAYGLIAAMNADIKGEPIEGHFSDFKFKCNKEGFLSKNVPLLFKRPARCKLKANIYDPDSTQLERIVLMFDINLKDGSPESVFKNRAILKIYSNEKSEAQQDAELAAELELRNTDGSQD
jgi:hypothetical protein